MIASARAAGVGEGVFLARPASDVRMVGVKAAWRRVLIDVYENACVCITARKPTKEAFIR